MDHDHDFSDKRKNEEEAEVHARPKDVDHGNDESMREERNTKNFDLLESYYWRDFAGEIPHDALPGGTDINGKPIYIGQVLDPERRFLIPAKIYINNPRAYYEHSGQELIAVNNVKILCAQHPEHFEWVKTNTNDIELLNDKHLVIGGFEPGCTTYIGRTRLEGEVLVGKVLADNGPENQGLHLTRNGKKTLHTSYQVLAYSPKVLELIAGYYWRDFTGEIPSDALASGLDVNGKPIYIGQVLDPELRFLIPAKIYVNDPQAYYEHSGQELKATSNVKIFCTQHPEHFKWIKTNTNGIKLLNVKFLVLGGYEPGCTTYIGRARLEGEVLVGKALADNGPENQGLHLTSNRKKTLRASFEVLAYNPKALDIKAK